MSAMMELNTYRNLGQPIIEVKWSGLIRASHESAYRSECPVCEDGLLLIHRHQTKLYLLEEDCCMGCGQRVKYLDIDNLREAEGIHP